MSIENHKSNSGEIVMKAGQYVLGDPCYTFTDNHDDWMDLLNENDFFQIDPVGIYILPDGTQKKVCFFGTAYGDGGYKDNHGFEYPVDAGMIGIIPYTDGDPVPHGTRVVEFTEDFICFDLNGWLHFGDININTAGDDEEVYEDEDEIDYEIESDNY